MKINLYIFISVFALLAGAFFTAIHYEWIIMRFPLQKTITKSSPTFPKSERKKVTLYFWHHDAWHTETTEMLVCPDTAQTLEHLVQTWLTTLEEEGMAEKKIPLQAALVSSSGLSYISLARSPFSAEEPTLEKLMWIEGLLKSIKSNIQGIQQVQLLVNHKPLQDPHLDFASPWPVSGWM